MQSPKDPTKDPRFKALFEVLGRTGAANVQVRWSDDEEPTVWLAVAVYHDARWDAAAAPNPLEALIRLAEQLIDGGMCAHCNRGTMFDPEITPKFKHPQLCVWTWRGDRYEMGCK